MKIAVLLSGGVDSSVALGIMKEAGHDITAYYMKIWLEEDMSFMGECPWEDDLIQARSVCERFNVPLKIMNLQREYFDIVVKYTIEELKSGRTPSPDIMCNKNIKFGVFFDKVVAEGYDKIVSGHYASVEEKGGNFHLVQAIDPVKDQTYFLTYLNQEQMKKVCFPLGGMMKSEVREKAHQFGLINAERKDSQGICFLGKIKYNDFVKYYLGQKTGDIIELETGIILGTHNGYWFHTIGQRQGLGLSGGPWYVAKKDIEKNIVYVSHNIVETQVSCDTFVAENINWIVGRPENTKLECKLRHGPKKVECEIEFLAEDKVRVKLAEDDQGISPGQFAIFYKENECLGGGRIALV